MSELTPEERQRVRRYLDLADELEKKAAQREKQSFFSWLWEKGLGYIVQKLLDLVWAAIRAIFGF